MMRARLTTRMETRLKFLGNVGQVIGGAATFAAPHTFNQTNNVTLSAETMDQRPLLLRQRVNIAKRIEAIAKAEGIESDTIYRILVEDYGGESIKSLPRGHYRSIVADLDEWLNRSKEAGGGAASPRREASCKWIGLAGAVIGSLAAGMLLAGWNVSDAAPLQCHSDGKAFSIGAVTTMTGTHVYECIYDPAAYAHPYWVPARNLGSAGLPRPG